MTKLEAKQKDCKFPPIFAIKLNTELGTIQQLAVPTQSRKFFGKNIDKLQKHGFDKDLNPIELDTSQVFVRTNNSPIPAGFRNIIEVLDDNINHHDGLLDFR